MSPPVLPHEILLDCFELATEPPYFEPDRKKSHAFLLECARVCRSWTTPAQVLLFREVKFPKNDDGPEQGIRPYLLKFLDYLEAHTARGSLVLPNAVRSLTLAIGVSPSWDSDAQKEVDEIGCDLRTLVRVTKVLPNLMHLDLSSSLGRFDEAKYLADPEIAHFIQSVFEPAQMVELKRATQITSLTLRIISYDLPQLAQLLAAFPALTYLDITECSQLPDASALQTAGVRDYSNLATLRELRVATASVVEELAGHIQPGQFAVQTLHVKDLDSMQRLSPLRSSLKRLVVSDLRAARDQANQDLDPEAKRFPHLTEMILRGSSLHNSPSLANIVGTSPVAHLGLLFEPTRLSTCKDTVKLFEDTLGPPRTFVSVRSAAVYCASTPFFLVGVIEPKPEDLVRFEEERGFPLTWIYDGEILSIPGLPH
ncbi:hypothetical protein EXIGLDRAFT_725150 [Exidia glandulosa HHB12029]|uniref:F-box domain-containing protein n=1 Tax=Exidia glandulosa HHB12029 TaxID=1314781 RepID=A0A165E5Z8_EXIGL|nr:hypothetical protein EXIGLDRAFT_725150 [Exidia glandulosa HHB12029]